MFYWSEPSAGSPCVEDALTSQGIEMPKSDKAKRGDNQGAAVKRTDQDGTVPSSDAPLVDSALADIRDRRARQAAAVGTGRPRRAEIDDP